MVKDKNGCAYGYWKLRVRDAMKIFTIIILCFMMPILLTGYFLYYPKEY